MSHKFKIFPCKFSETGAPKVSIGFVWIPQALESALLFDQHSNLWRMFRTWEEAQVVYPNPVHVSKLHVEIPEHGIDCVVGYCVLILSTVTETIVPADSQELAVRKDPLFKAVHEAAAPTPVYWKEVGLSNMSRVLLFIGNQAVVPSKPETIALIDYMSKLKSTTIEADSVQSKLLKNLDKFIWNNGQIQLAECSLSKGLLWIVENGEPPKATALKGSTYMIAATLVASAFAQDIAVVFGQDKDGDALLTAYSLDDLGIEISSTIGVKATAKGPKAKQVKHPDHEAMAEALEEAKGTLLLPKAKVGKVSKFQSGESTLDV